MDTNNCKSLGESYGECREGLHNFPLRNQSQIGLAVSGPVISIILNYSGVCYNEQFLSIKSGCYNERCEILSVDVVRAWIWRVGPSRFD